MSEENKSPLDPWVKRYVELSARRPGAVLASLILLTVLLGLSLPRISLQTNIEALLPEHTISQRSNDEARDRYAGSAPYFLVVQSSDTAFNRRVAQEALTEVRKWPETIWAMRARDPSYFLDRRLLFVEEEALGEFADEVDAFVGYKKCAKMPGCFQLEDEAPPEPSFDKLQAELKSQPEVQSLSALFGAGTLDDVMGAGDEKKKEKQPNQIEGELCSKDGSVCVVQVTLKTSPRDLKVSRKLVSRGENLLKTLAGESAPQDTLTAVTGIYRDLPLTKAALMEDLTRTFSLGVALMMLVIMAQFRRLRALVLLFVPLIFGSVWTLGIFAWISPQLNLISAAGFIILAGLGIDFSLHLLTHFGAERQNGYCPTEAVLRTMVHLKSSLTVAALTTAFGFASLMAAAFRGFAQLGAFATLGIFSTLIAALLTFPPLVLGLQKVWPREGAFSRAWSLPTFLSRGFSRGRATFLSVLGLLALAVSLLLLPQLSLRQDLKPLMQQANSHGTHFRDALGGTSRGAVLLLADDPQSLEEAAAGVRRRYPNGLSEPEGAQEIKGETTGVAVITPGTFIPKQQDKKLEHIELLSDSAKDALRYGDEEWKKKLKPWLPLLTVREKITREGLPPWVQNSLKERDGTFGTVGLTYQDYPGSHAGKMLILSQKLELLRADHPRVRFASSSAVLGEVMPLLRQDGWRVTGLALLGLLIATLLIGRSRRRTTLILLTIFIAVSGTAAMMVVLDWRIDFYNLLVFPVAFGIGVDGAIYVVWSVLGRHDKFDWKDLPISARAVFGSTLTTLVVFLSLASSENGGLSSLGSVGSAALVISLFANLIWLPAALSWLKYRSEPS